MAYKNKNYKPYSKIVNLTPSRKTNKYSPDALLANIRNNNLKFKTTICTRTLYSYIDKGLFLHVTNKNLPFKGKRKKKKHKKVKPIKRPPNGTSIEKRPQYINDRSEFGHWEMDSIIGKREKGNTGIVLTERKTNKEIIIRATDKTALSTINVINMLENHYKENFKTIFKSITVDNGTEFKCFHQLEQSILSDEKRTQVYYCHPFASSERGQNEKQNQMIRRKIKKGTKIENYTDEYIEQTTAWLNEYPRKKYDYKCSDQLFYEELKKLGIKKLNNFRIYS
jgi:IS30 family transposase